MKITVGEEIQPFYLAFDEWILAHGHELKVGSFRFCVIPLKEEINVSEVTTGLKVIDIPLSPNVLSQTVTKEDTLLFFERIGEFLNVIIDDPKAFRRKLRHSQMITVRQLGGMPVGD